MPDSLPHQDCQGHVGLPPQAHDERQDAPEQTKIIRRREPIRAAAGLSSLQGISKLVAAP